jgi:hypothetical protein
LRILFRFVFCNAAAAPYRRAQAGWNKERLAELSGTTPSSGEHHGQRHFIMADRGTDPGHHLAAADIPPLDHDPEK